MKLYTIPKSLENMEISDEAKTAARKLNGRNGTVVNLDTVSFKVDIVAGPCWQWALLGGKFMAGSDLKSPEIFYRSIFNWSGEAEVSKPASLNEENALNYPEADAYLKIIRQNLPNALKDDYVAQDTIRVALLSACIVITSKKTLIPTAANTSVSLYKIHMMVPLDGNDWYRRGLHWGVSLAANDDGSGARCYIQTVTGKPLRTACDKIWDEHFRRCDIAVEGLNENHVIALG